MRKNCEMKGVINILILVGKTCSGKDTIQNELIKRGMEPVVSYTTRPPRHGEVDGKTYHFISESEFICRKESGFFAETTSYNVAVNGEETWHYGSALEDLSHNKVMIVNPEGLKVLKKNVNLNPIAFYIMADEETIWNRLRQRGDNAEEARRRLNADEEDFADINKYIDFSFRNDLGIKPEIIAEMILCTYLKTMEEVN